MPPAVGNMPPLRLEVSQENAQRLADAVARRMAKDRSLGTLQDALDLVLRTFAETSEVWNRVHETLEDGMSGPDAREVFTLAIRMCEGWLRAVSIIKPFATYAQSETGTPAKVREELAAALAQIEAGVEKINAVREDVAGALALINHPKPDVDPVRLAEAEKEFAQGRSLNFKEAIAARRARQK